MVSDTSSEKKGGSPPADGEREQGRALSDRRKRNEKREERLNLFHVECATGVASLSW
jgi:hypothetical protein